MTRYNTSMETEGQNQKVVIKAMSIVQFLSLSVFGLLSSSL